jgi:hypothetical protein
LRGPVLPGLLIQDFAVKAKFPIKEQRVALQLFARKL